MSETHIPHLPGVCDRGNYHRNYWRFQKSSTKNSSKRPIAPLPERRFPPPWSVENVIELVSARRESP